MLADAQERYRRTAAFSTVSVWEVRQFEACACRLDEREAAHARAPVDAHVEDHAPAEPFAVRIRESSVSEYEPRG
jgi:hypothetical protein